MVMKATGFSPEMGMKLMKPQCEDVLDGNVLWEIMVDHDGFRWFDFERLIHGWIS